MRHVPAYSGVGLLALVWGLPLSDWLGPFPGHMLRHMTIVAVAAPLLVLGWPRATRGFAISPLAATVLEFLVVWSFHLPVLHGWARSSVTGHLMEQGMFLLAGLCVWAGCLRAGGLAGAGGLLLTSMHMTLLGALLTLAPRDLFASLSLRGVDLAGQQLGGMIMLAIGTPIYLIAGLWLARRDILADTQVKP